MLELRQKRVAFYRTRATHRGLKTRLMGHAAKLRCRLAFGKLDRCFIEIFLQNTEQIHSHELENPNFLGAIFPAPIMHFAHQPKD